MHILLDLSKKDLVHLALFDADSIEHKTYPGQNRELLLCLEQFLHEKNLSKKDVHGIMVVVGSGGFTSTRIAVVVANSFTYVWGIPVLAITLDQVNIVQQLIPALITQPKGQYISATYSAEANIGKGKMVLGD